MPRPAISIHELSDPLDVPPNSEVGGRVGVWAVVVLFSVVTVVELSSVEVVELSSVEVVELSSVEVVVSVLTQPWLILSLVEESTEPT